MGLKLGLSHSGNVFENGVSSKIFGLKREEVTADWRELQNEELHNLC